MSSTRQKLAKAVRRLRTEPRYSQVSFADAIIVHRAYIGTVERGETNISLDNIVRIAKGLKVSLAEFFTEVERDVR